MRGLVCGGLLIGWAFFAGNYWHMRTVGGFPDQATCESVRAQVATSRTFDAVDSWGFISDRCWPEG